MQLHKKCDIFHRNFHNTTIFDLNIQAEAFRVGKVWNWSNLVLIKVVVFFIKFDKNFVWTKYFFHTYGFLSLEGPLLAGLCSCEPGPVSRACSKVKKPYVWKKYFVQANFLSNLVKKSTTFINAKLLSFSTLPTVMYTEMTINVDDLDEIGKGFENDILLCCALE